MDNMEDKIENILGNPEMMQKIMAMAQSLNSPPSDGKESSNQEAGGFFLPDIDIGMVQKLSGLAGQANIDSDQRTLLKALSPYLSKDRIYKLEKAMRAAKMAGLASMFLGNTGQQFPIGR